MRARREERKIKVRQAEALARKLGEKKDRRAIQRQHFETSEFGPARDKARLQLKALDQEIADLEEDYDTLRRRLQSLDDTLGRDAITQAIGRRNAIQGSMGILVGGMLIRCAELAEDRAKLESGRKEDQHWKDVCLSLTGDTSQTPTFSYSTGADSLWMQALDEFLRQSQRVERELQRRQSPSR